MQWKLILLRKKAGYTQKDMATLLDMKPSAYSRRETGKTKFDFNEMYKIREIFKMPIDDIFLPTNCIENANEEMAVAL